MNLVALALFTVMLGGILVALDGVKSYLASGEGSDLVMFVFGIALAVLSFAWFFAHG